METASYIHWFAILISLLLCVAWFRFYTKLITLIKVFKQIPTDTPIHLSWLFLLPVINIPQQIRLIGSISKILVAKPELDQIQPRVNKYRAMSILFIGSQLLALIPNLFITFGCVSLVLFILLWKQTTLLTNELAQRT